MELSGYVDVLPANAISPVHPFGGVVVNFNVCTRIHRDHQDAQDICIVLPIYDGIGGELVLYELGLVVNVRSGEIIIFRSSQISHFNLHFTGRRASFVFHSDRAGQFWVDDRNGWDQHWYYSYKSNVA